MYVHVISKIQYLLFKTKYPVQRLHRVNELVKKEGEVYYASVFSSLVAGASGAAVSSTFFTGGT